MARVVATKWIFHSFDLDNVHRPTKDPLLLRLGSPQYKKYTQDSTALLAECCRSPSNRNIMGL